jgi:hypothetical protein
MSVSESAVWAGELEAIRSFIGGSTPQTDEASRLRNDFIRRWNQLSFFERTLPSQAIYHEFKNRENQYWIANRPIEERENAVSVVKNNLESGQLTGGVFPEDERLKNVDAPDISVLDEQIEAAKPWLPDWVGPVALSSAVITGVVWLVPRLLRFTPAGLLKSKLKLLSKTISKAVN